MCVCVLEGAEDKEEQTEKLDIYLSNFWALKYLVLTSWSGKAPLLLGCHPRESDCFNIHHKY